MSDSLFDKVENAEIEGSGVEFSEIEQATYDLSMNAMSDDMQNEANQASNAEQEPKIISEIPQAQQILETIEPDKPVNLIELTREQGSLLNDLKTKAERLERMSLDEEGKGLLVDFKEKVLALDEKTNKIMVYFSNNISDEDRALINKTLLLKGALSELYDLLKFYENKDYIAKTKEFEKKFKNLVHSSKERVENFENNLKKYLDASIPSYKEILQAFITRTGEFLDKFYKEQENKTKEFADFSKNSLKEITSNFELTSKKLKHFALALLCGFGIFGILFGVISAMTYLKYKEYQEIEAKMHSIKERISNISIRKDENNKIIISLPKSNTAINSDESKIYIILKEVQMK